MVGRARIAAAQYSLLRATVDPPNTTRGVLVAEKAGSPNAAFGPNNANRAVRQFWHLAGKGSNQYQIWSMSQQFLGFTSFQAAANGNPAYLSRLVPVDHPSFAAFLWAESVAPVEQSVPEGQDAAGVGVPDEWLLSVVYTSRDYEIMTDTALQTATGKTYPDETSLRRYVSYFDRMSGYYQTLPSVGGLRWAHNPPYDPPQPMVNKKGVLLSEADLQVTWHMVPLKNVPYTAWRNCVNHCNQAQFGGNGSIVPPYPLGTLVCLWPTKSRPYRWVDGVLYVDITYNFKVYPAGANYFYRWDTTGGNTTGSYQLATFDGTTSLTNSLYPPADFTTLFIPQAS